MRLRITSVRWYHRQGPYLSILRILQQREDIFRRQSRAAFCAFEQVVGEVAFVFVELNDLVFDGGFGGQTENGHGALLTDAVQNKKRPALLRGVQDGVIVHPDPWRNQPVQLVIEENNITWVHD